MMMEQRSNSKHPALEGAEHIGKLPGVTLMTKSRMISSWGEAASEFLDKKLKPQFPFDPDYQPYPYISHAEAYERAEIIHKELQDVPEHTFSSRCDSVLSDGAYKQQFKGIVHPTTIIRKQLNLVDFDNDPQTVGGQSFDSLYKECVRVLVECVKEGIRHSGIADDPEYFPRVVAKKGSNRGYPSFKGGPEGDEWMIKRIDECLRHEDGLFYDTDHLLPIALGVRVQNAGVVSDGNGGYRSKERAAVIHNPNRPLSNPDFYFGKVINPGGRPLAQRVRDVSAISQVQNPPLMVFNAIFNDSMSPKMKKIWKDGTTVDQLNEFVGELAIATDYSKFDSTFQEGLRRFIADTLYSDELAHISKLIDTSPIIGGYSAAKDIDEESIVRYAIDRSVEGAAEIFSLLLSGTGDTSSNGKFGGAADQLRTVCLLTDVTPAKALALGDPEDVNCLAARTIRNGGDDAFTSITRCAEFDVKGRSSIELVPALVDIILQPSVFDRGLEVPTKYTGYLFRTDYSDLLDSDLSERDFMIEYLSRPILSVSHDPLSMFTNHMWPEHSHTSVFRSPPAFGLASAIDVYGSTIRPWMDVEFPGLFDDMVDKLLYAVGFPGDYLDLLDEAEIEEKQLDAEINEIDDEGNTTSVASAIHLITKQLGLKNQSELDWKYSKAELFDLVDHDLLAKIYILFPKELVTPISKFVKY